MYAHRTASGSTTNAHNTTQIRSGLGSMKRAWSGNQLDMGNSSRDTKPSTTDANFPSSDERFYEWSDTPSPPQASARAHSALVGPDKENAFEITASKRMKSEAAHSTLLGAAQHSKPSGAQSGFVSASNVHKTNAYAARETSSSQSSSMHTGALSKSTSGGKSSSFYKAAELGNQFAMERKSLSASTYTPSSLDTRTGNSQRVGDTRSTQMNRSSSASSTAWLNSATQMRELKKNDATNPLSNPIVKRSVMSNEQAPNPAPSGRQEQVNKLFLSTEQHAVLRMVVQQGKNVFFTGSAGTGKSVLLREIIRELRRKNSKKPESIAVTASTGIAACNIGGTTLHSFAGFGLGKEDVNALIGKIRKNRKAATRWLRTQILIIDEISMVEPSLLDKLNEIAQILKKRKDKPFGGIQVIMTGDFFQLPPVSPGKATTFAFQAECWDRVVENKVNLTQVFRQKDSTFVNMLNEMRFGKLSQKTIEAFSKLARTPEYGSIVPTELFPLRNEVERANKRRLDGLQTEQHTYTAVDGGSLDAVGRFKMLENFMALASLTLKKDAQVMLIKNLDETLVNGSIGTVIDFMDEQEYTQTLDMPTQEQGKEDRNKIVRTSQRKWPLVRFQLPNKSGTRDYLAVPESWKVEEQNGNVLASRTQVPLILAWAMSIHKAQGQTLPCCKINLNNIFEKGQAYVALSRATSLGGLEVHGFRSEKVLAHPAVIEWSKTLLALD